MRYALSSIKLVFRRKKARLYLCSLQLLLQLEKSESREAKQREVTSSYKKIYSMLGTTEETGEKINTKNYFFFFFFLYSEPKSPSHRVNKEQTGDGTGRTQPTSGLGILKHDKNERED